MGINISSDIQYNNSRDKLTNIFRDNNYKP